MHNPEPQTPNTEHRTPSPPLPVSLSPRLRVFPSPPLPVSLSPRLRVFPSPPLPVSPSPRPRVFPSPPLPVSLSPRLPPSPRPRVFPIPLSLLLLLFTVHCSLFTLSSSADTLHGESWQIECSRPAPHDLTILRGESLTLVPQFLERGVALTLTNASAVALQYRDTTLATGLFYSVSGTISDATNGYISIPLTATNFPAATVYTYTIAARSAAGDNLRGFGTIRLQATVGGITTNVPTVYAPTPWTDALAIIGTNVSATNSSHLGGIPAAGYVQTNNPALTNDRNPTAHTHDWNTLTGTAPKLPACTNADTVTTLTTAQIAGAGGVTNRVPIPLTYTSTNIYTDASIANTFRVTLTNNATLQLPTGAMNGQTVRWWVKQGTGTNTLNVVPSIYYPTGTTNLALSTAIGARDLLIGEYDSSTTNLFLTGLLPFGK